MSASVGQKLRQARQARDLSLEKAARDTYIRPQYIQALEAGRLDALPSDAQARGFLRTYANYLGVDPEPLLMALRTGEEVVFPTEPAAERVPQSGRNADTGDTPDSIYREMGIKLRIQRELLGFSLPEVERQTHLKLHYIKALEAGDYSPMPSPVQARGMLHNYGEFLGLDADALLLRYAEALQMELAFRRGPVLADSKEPRKQSSSGSGPSGLRRLISADLVFGVTTVAVLLAFVIWAAVRVNTLTAGTAPVETAPPIAGVILPTPTPSPTVTPSPIVPLGVPVVEEGADSLVTGEENAGGATATPSLEIVLPTQSDAQVQVYVVARQRAWARMTVDGVIQFEGRVVPGSAYSFSGRDTVELLTGNAAALQVFYNQQDLGTLGVFGEVVNRIFTPSGIINPAPTATPVPEIPLVTATPEPTEAVLP